MIPNYFYIIKSLKLSDLTFRTILVSFRTFRGPLFDKPVADRKLFLEARYFEVISRSYRINLVPFRTFRGPLFHKPVPGWEHIFEARYFEAALVS